MKIREIINEDDGGSADSGEGNPGTGGKTSGKREPMEPNHKAAIKDMVRFPEMPSYYYNMYRFGVHMAGSPGDQPMKALSPNANELTVLAYSDADADIVNKTKKELGLKGKTMTSKDSKEHDVNVVSPVAKRKKNKYGI
jgi:hypothetical protein